MSSEKGRSAIDCPLCRSSRSNLFHVREDSRSDKRFFYSCDDCGLVHVPSEFHLNAEDEKSRYTLHRNALRDQGYRDFLNRLASPIIERITEGARGIDFGCGPAPLLKEMFEEEGFSAVHYDPIFFPDASVLERSYDFAALSEVAEHLRDPRETFALLDKLIVPGGIVGVMTRVLPAPEAFAEWYYHRDPTHIAFYGRKTLEWIAEWRGWQAEFLPGHVVIFKKQFL